MNDHAPDDDHQRTLAWLDDSLGRAGPGGQTPTGGARLVELLNLVRTEVLFDAESSRHLPATVDLDLKAQTGA